MLMWPVQASAFAAGWSSLVARRAHNPKVAGSNPAPATKYSPKSGTGFTKVRAGCQSTVPWPRSRLWARRHFIGDAQASGWLSGCAALDDPGFVLIDAALTEDLL